MKKIFSNKINSVIFVNYLFIAYAFCLPLSKNFSNIIFSAIIILFFIDGDIKNKLRFIIKDKVILSILAFILIHLLWLFGTDYFLYAQDKLSAMKHFLAILIIVTMVKKEFVLKIISAFIISMLFSEFISYMIFFGFLEPINNATKENPVPFMLNHSLYSTFLALALGMLLYSLFKKDFKTSKLTLFISLFFTISISFNILIISSRLGYVLLFATIFSMTIIFYGKYLVRTILSTLIVVTIFYMIAYLNLDTFKERIHQAKNNIEKIIVKKDFTTSEGIRAGFWFYSLELLNENPFFGTGTGDHINYVKNKIIESKYYNQEPMLNILEGGTNTGLHADYLDIFVQFGLIGLLIFLNIFYQIVRYKTENEHLKALQVILVVVMLVQALPQGMVYLAPINKLFILLLALTLNLYQNKIDELKIGSR